MAANVTTPAQVAGTSGMAIGFGILLWLWVRFLVIPLWGRTDADRIFQWLIPGLFVVGGTIGECVALIGGLTGTTWRTG